MLCVTFSTPRSIFNFYVLSVSMDVIKKGHFSRLRKLVSFPFRTLNYLKSHAKNLHTKNLLHLCANTRKQSHPSIFVISSGLVQIALRRFNSAEVSPKLPRMSSANKCVPKLCALKLPRDTRFFGPKRLRAPYAFTNFQQALERLVHADQRFSPPVFPR